MEEKLVHFIFFLFTKNTSNRAVVGNIYMKVGATGTELTRYEHWWQRSSPRTIAHNQTSNSDASREKGF
jgi:hypothetical protein